MPPRPPAKRVVADDGDDGAMDMDSPESGLARSKQPRLDGASSPNAATVAGVNLNHPASAGPAPDFSSIVKSRLSTYSRTGQACDRCKIRKIRCDALPTGCSHCSNQGLECFVTDRVTGRTERRGYLQELEKKQDGMIDRIRELERLLDWNGIQVKPFDPITGAGHFSPDNMVDYKIKDRERNQWHKLGNLWVKATSNKAHARASMTSRPADLAHLGVVSDVEPLSSIKGTVLSVLGTALDITQFNALDMDMDEPDPNAPASEGLYNKSVQAFLQSAMNINRPPDAHLPTRKDVFQYSEWYFLMIHPFLPMLHKPTYLNLLVRIYDHGHKPTVPEEVIVHMVLATIYFQYGVRNWEKNAERKQLNELSNTHYHYALSKMFYLASDPTFEAVQAMAMIAGHTRCFPKPGPGILISNFAFNAAIGLNLHRHEPIEPGRRTKLQDEVRKRVFWTILTVLVTLNGRLGRPMPIALEEIDVDFPEPIPDELLTDDGVTRGPGVCSYLVGLAGFKIVPLFMEMYNTIYCARRNPAQYLDNVASVEEQLREWEEDLPAELRVDPTRIDDATIYALFAQTFSLELRLCLRHPSVTMTDDPGVAAENMRLTEETSHKMLLVMDTLLKKKSLDTTWYQIAVYVGAIFSTLAAYWYRGSELEQEDITALREEMRKWLDIVRASGVLLGSGKNELATRVGGIIERTLTPLVDNLRQRDAHRATSGVNGTGTNHLTSYGGRDTSAPATNGSHDGLDSPRPNISFTAANQSAGAESPMLTGFTAAIQQAAAAATNASVPANVSAAAAQAQAQAQAHQHPQLQHAWRPGDGLNPWMDWTAAIAAAVAETAALDGQDRYMATSLVALGLADSIGGTGTGHVVEGDWPLLLFPAASTTPPTAVDPRQQQNNGAGPSGADRGPGHAD